MQAAASTHESSSGAHPKRDLTTQKRLKGWNGRDTLTLVETLFSPCQMGRKVGLGARNTQPLLCKGHANG
jgi:hypothetical protein